jgi:hypothetical protein
VFFGGFIGSPVVYTKVIVFNRYVYVYERERKKKERERKRER